MNVYYLCGPMTGIPDLNFPAFAEACAALRAAGDTVLSPHEVPDEATWEGCLRSDLAQMVTKASALVLLPGWPSSRGAKLELSVALALGFDVFFYDAGRLIPMGRQA